MEINIDKNIFWVENAEILNWKVLAGKQKIFHRGPESGKIFAWKPCINWNISKCLRSDLDLEQSANINKNMKITYNIYIECHLMRYDYKLIIIWFNKNTEKFERRGKLWICWWKKSPGAGPGSTCQEDGSRIRIHFYTRHIWNLHLYFYIADLGSRCGSESQLNES